MENYQVYLSHSAVRDLIEIAAYMAQDLQEPSTAKKLIEKIRASVESLTELPFRHALVSDERLAALGFRQTMVGSYILFYQASEEEKTVSIVRILYDRRNWIHLL